MLELDFTATVFESESGSWYWAELDPPLSDLINRFTGGPTGGWGSIKVEARIGATIWNTSLFLSDEDTYLLPLKKEVRRAESIDEGDEVEVAVRI